jgi:hypothetical protein
MQLLDRSRQSSARIRQSTMPDEEVGTTRRRQQVYRVILQVIAAHKGERPAGSDRVAGGEAAPQAHGVPE